MWGFERRFVDPDEIDQGPLRTTRLWHITLGLWLVLSLPLLFMPLMPIQMVVLLVFLAGLARLVVLDLKYLLLLDIYTLPLAFLGVATAPWVTGHSWLWSGAGLGAGLGIGLAFEGILRLLKRRGELGFGDVKMMALMGAWVGLFNLPFALAIACLAGLVASFCVPRGQAFPFGPALAAGTWGWLMFGDYLLALLRQLA